MTAQLSPLVRTALTCPTAIHACCGLQVKKSWTISGSGFSYAFVTAWFMMNAMFLLLTGVVLSGAKHHTNTFEQSPQWSTSGAAA